MVVPRLGGFHARFGAVVIAASIWILLIGTEYGGPGVAQAVSNVGLATAALAAAAGCFSAGLRQARATRLRRVWMLLALGVSSWGVGQTIWTWYESVEGREVPLPSLADVGYLGFIPFAVAAFLSLPSSSATNAGRARTILDGLIIAGAAFLTSWVLVLKPVLSATEDSLVVKAIVLAYPAGDLVLVTLVVYTILRTRQDRTKPEVPIGLLGVGLIGFSIADSAFVYLTAAGTYSSGAFTDIGWFLGFTLVLVAAMRASNTTPRDEQRGDSLEPLAPLVPYFAVFIALTTTTFDLVRTGLADQTISWVRSFIIIAMVVRQILTLHENRMLTGRLEARLVDLRASEQRFEALVQHSSDVVTVVDRTGIVVYQSESIHRVFGHAAEDVLSMDVLALLAPSSVTAARAALDAIQQEAYAVRVLPEVEIRHASGRFCFAEITVTNLLEDASVGGIVLNTRDISERKVLQDQLVHEAFHDALTTLANRSLFRDRVETLLLDINRQEGQIGVLFLDLNGFKEVNDSLGHAAGDLLLIQVAERLRSCVRPDDVVARFGGDEFAILIDDMATQLDGVAIAERIEEALREPFRVDGNDLHISASIGIAAADADVEDADHLLRNADLAMYRAKSKGDGSFERYLEGMHSGLIERIRLEADLRRAISNDDLVLHYQPTVDLATGVVAGVEALVRWPHPTRGLLSPLEFIPLAEASGQIRDLGRWVLHEACEQLALWRTGHRELDELAMSVNVSGRHLQHPGLHGDIADALTASGIPPHQLVLEMTESVLMTNTAENVDILERIRALSVRLAIDDFGTGYSSLAYLHRFPADVLKIDRSFTDRIANSTKDLEIVRTIVRLGQSMQMVNVAEGVETTVQATILRSIGCEIGQGYRFSRPLPAGEVEPILLRSHHDVWALEAA